MTTGLHGTLPRRLTPPGATYELAEPVQTSGATSMHDWSIATREHPWTNKETESSGFIDLVLKHDHFVTYRMVIECKRVKADDRRQLQWIFLVPEEEKKETQLASCLEVGGTTTRSVRVGEPDVAEKGWDHVRIWETVNICQNRLSALSASFLVMIQRASLSWNGLLQRLLTQLRD